jgi:ubiquitin C-terminal hydrolase
MGSLHGGHYTASARNFENMQWFDYDDDCITPILEKDVVSHKAYLLFYRKRKVLGNL